MELSKCNVDRASENERAIVQLAGCLMAAEGNTDLDGKSEVYGWSPAYQAVVELRRRCERDARDTTDLRTLAVETIEFLLGMLKDYVPSGDYDGIASQPAEVLDHLRAGESKTLTPAEAVFGVLAWLSTTADHGRQLDAVIDSPQAADAAKKFCDANGLGECSDSWPQALVMPT